MMVLVTTTVSMAQTIQVTGTVNDASTGQALPGVNVQIIGTTLGTITGADGNYALSDVDRNATLIFSFIGYEAQEVTVENRNVVNIAFVQSVTDLDEVVVVGYTTQKRANVVGAVTSISGSTLQSIPAASVSNAISGHLVGSTVMQRLCGEPGNLGATILIRGRSTLTPSYSDITNMYKNTAPLIIINGVPGRSMDELDPNDIASISVLKDASAAIYGVGAANGVILITTKRGTEGKPKVNYQFYQGFMTLSMIPEVCDASEYATMLSEFQTGAGKTPTYSETDIELFRNDKDPWEHPNTDWYGDLIKKWTNTYRHSLTLDGGNRGMTYYISLGLKGDEAMYKQSSTSYNQYNVRAKVDLPITSWLKSEIDLAGFELRRLYPYSSASTILFMTLLSPPTKWAYWPDGKPGPDLEYGANPVVSSSFAGGKSDQKTYRWQSTFSMTASPPFIKGFSLTGNFAYDLTNFYNKAFYKPWILYFPNWAAATRDPATGFITSMTTIPVLRGMSSPRNTEFYQRTINQTLDLGAIYTRKFGNHSFMLLGTFEQYTSDFNGFQGFRQYYISPAIQTMNAGGDQDKNNAGTASIYAIRSWIGRATYDYKGKYIAELVFRRDGSLKFPPKS